MPGGPTGYRTTPSSAGSRTIGSGITHSWWLVGLRGLAALAFAASLLVLPQSMIASLVLLFAAYVGADGAFALLVANRARRQGARWLMLVYEGLTNLAVAGGVLVWQALALVPLVRVASLWAVVTGAFMLAAAHRLSGPHGRWLLFFAGGISAAWGALATVADQLETVDPQGMRRWLIVYALLFGAILLGLATQLLRRHRGAEIASAT